MYRLKRFYNDIYKVARAKLENQVTLDIYLDFYLDQVGILFVLLTQSCLSQSKGLCASCPWTLYPDYGPVLTKNKYLRSL